MRAPEDVRFTAADGYSLAGTVFEGEPPLGSPIGSVVIAGAMGVHRRFYAPFAGYLASRGFTTVTFDYRGVGGSAPDRLRGFETSLHTWGEQDLDAAIRLATERAPGAPVLYVAHSVGGQLIGLIPQWQRLRAAVMVASQSGHWRLWPGKGRYAMWALWHLGIPLMTRLYGYLPMKQFGQGENIPRGVASEWARWGRHPDYVLSYAAQRGDAAFDKFDRPLRAYVIDDDTYAPPPTVEKLFHAYTAARKELKHVKPEQVGQQQLGHFGFFRPKLEPTLWKDTADWLQQQLSRSA